MVPTARYGHNGKSVIVIDYHSGAIVSEHNIEPEKGYQPKNQETRQPSTWGFTCPRCPGTSHGASDGNRTRAISLGS